MFIKVAPVFNPTNCCIRGLESFSSEPQDQIAPSLSIGSNPSIWPIPAFCLVCNFIGSFYILNSTIFYQELEDLTVRVRATDIVYFASGGFSTVWRGAWVDPADGPPHKVRRIVVDGLTYSEIPCLL